MLVVGAEAMVRGASRLAIALGVSPLIVGLTVVSFSTSSPELAVSVQSSLANQADIALGNVVGSNIVNVLIVLGASALIIPLIVHQQLVRLDVPIMIGVSVLTLVFSLDGNISQFEGVLLVGGLVLYMLVMVYLSRRQKQAGTEDFDREYSDNKPRGMRAMALNLGFIALGLVLLVVGSGWMVDGAVQIARLLGISELIIGLTVVAVGTSLPEIVTSIVAALRGERDIAVGNVVGSNIFNILGVLGLAAVASSSGVAVSPAALSFDLPIMIVVALICLPIFFSNYHVERWEGALFVALYIAYIAHMILAAAQSPVLLAYANVMTVLIVIMVIALAVLSIRQLRRDRAAPAD